MASTTNDDDDDDDDDSDDDPSIPEHPTSPDNMLRVITSPINHFEIPSNSSSTAAVNAAGSSTSGQTQGVDHNGNNMLDRSNNNDSYVNHNAARLGSRAEVPNGAQKRIVNNNQHHHQADANNESSSSYNQVYDHTYSSRSNSRLSSSYDYDCSSSNDETFAEYFHNKKKLMACAATNGNNNNNREEDEDDDQVPSRRRPDYNRDLLNHTPDSGIATGPCSSVSTTGVPSSAKSRVTTPSAEPMPGTSGTAELATTTSSKLFQAKVARVRKNYRKHFCDDSDSE